MASIITISDWQITFSTLSRNTKSYNHLTQWGILIGPLKFAFWLAGRSTDIQNSSGFLRVLWCFMRKFMALIIFICSNSSFKFISD